jgi:hypothetical protein
MSFYKFLLVVFLIYLGYYGINIVIDLLRRPSQKTDDSPEVFEVGDIGSQEQVNPIVIDDNDKKKETSDLFLNVQHQGIPYAQFMENSKKMLSDIYC